MKKALLTKLFLFLIVGGMYAQLGEIDKTFNPSIGAGANKNITSVAVQTDGKIIIAGEFTNYANTSKNRIARLNADGTLDPTFNIGDGASNDISDVKLQSDGKIIIIGRFTSFNGLKALNIARLNSDGSVDTTFIPPADLFEYKCFAIQANGKILISGTYRDSNGFYASKIVRLEPNGALDTTFDNGTGPILPIEELAIQGDGKIIIVGRFLSYAGVGRAGVARINQDGTLDPTFDPGSGADNNVKTVSIQSDNKIIISGLFKNYNGSPTNGIARLNPDGTKDNTFITSIQAKSTIYSIVVQANGKILVGGDFTSFNNTVANRIVRLNSDATIDLTFNSGIGVDKTVFCIAEQTDEKIIIAGDFSSYKETLRGRLARINTDGTIDTAFFNPEGFGSGSNDNISSVALQADGKIIIVGAFTSYNGIKKEAAVRLNADGTLDKPFNPITTGRGSAVEYCVVVQPDQKILLAGRHTTFDGTLKSNLIRMNAEDGTLDETFRLETAPLVPDIYSIALQTDGKILIGGTFTYFAGVARNHIARLNANGFIDNTFNPGTGANDDISSIIVQTDGKILIIGDFTSYNGVARNHIARLNPDGTLDITFDPGNAANKSLYSIAVQTDGKILIGGSFTTYNNTSINCIARLNTDGTLDSTFNTGTGANGAVTTIKLKADGKILIAGIFEAYNGIERKYIAELNVDGTLDSTFNQGSGINYLVQDILVQPDGNIIVVGNFTSYDDNTVGRVIRILSDTTPLANEEFKKESFMIYPNPSTGIFNINSNQNIESASIKVFDLNGRIVHQSKAENLESKSLDLKSLQNGIYILNIENEGYNYSQKIIKK